MKDDFLMPLSGLAPGRTSFLWHMGKAFFGEFGNTDILDADISVEANVEKEGKDIYLDLRLDGTVKVICDRCLSEVVLPVEAAPRFVIRFDPSAPEMEGEREVLVADDAAEMDLHQVVYDYVYMSLPIQRTHPEGECDPETVRFLGRDTVEESHEESPFAALGRLLTRNNNLKNI